MKKNKAKGFTLIELIVVLIILGLLASLAIPAYFSWIKRSQSAEAMLTAASIKSWLVPCLRAHVGTENACFSSQEHCSSNFTGGPPTQCWDYITPGSPNFKYQIFDEYITMSGNEYNIDTDSQGWTIAATSVTNAEDILVLSGDGSNNQSACFGVGLFAGAC